MPHYLQWHEGRYCSALVGLLPLQLACMPCKRRVQLHLQVLLDSRSDAGALLWFSPAGAVWLQQGMLDIPIVW